MKKLLLLMFSLVALSASAQEYLWIVEGKTAGEDMVSVPQSYIGDELNFGNLFITAPHGTRILSPVDGTINYVNMGYNASLTRSSSFKFDSNKSFDENWEEMNENVSNLNTNFVYGGVAIKPTDDPRKTIWINGLRGNYSFKTGQTIKRGEPLGEISYSYKEFNEPTINLSISKNGSVDDPMTPFGVKSTFVQPKEQKPIKSISKEEAREDVNVLYDATIDIFPSLSTLMSLEESEALRCEMLHYIDTLSGDQVSVGAFLRKLKEEYRANIWDSHLSWRTPTWQKDEAKYRGNPATMIGFSGDTLRIYATIDSKRKYVGREVVEINGISADSLRKLAVKNIKSHDALVQSNLQCALTFNGFSMLQSFNDFKGEYNLVLDGGEKVTFGMVYNTNGYADIESIIKFMNTNRHPSLYESRMLNDSVAYLGISSFKLSEVKTEEIATIVDSISKARVKNLIVDVRNNSGGEAAVLTRLASLFLKDTLWLTSHEKVNSNTTYKSLKHSMNYGDDITVFSDYEPGEGIDGFYKDTTPYYAPSADSIHYDGNLYILTNENSISAATLFPSIMVRAHRGVSVGRETRTAYHYMTAMKFADIVLPNTKQPITLPMVQAIFDTVVNERVPYGRGLLPDYPVELTHDEILYKSGDTILDYTLQLIDQGKYLSPANPFEVQESEETTNLWRTYKLHIAIAVVLLFAIGFWVKYKV